jgi:hypothetical protein
MAGLDRPCTHGRQASACAEAAHHVEGRGQRSRRRSASLNEGAHLRRHVDAAEAESSTRTRDCAATTPCTSPPRSSSRRRCSPVPTRRCARQLHVAVSTSPIRWRRDPFIRGHPLQRERRGTAAGAGSSGRECEGPTWARTPTAERKHDGRTHEHGLRVQACRARPARSGGFQRVDGQTEWQREGPQFASHERLRRPSRRSARGLVRLVKPDRQCNRHDVPRFGR